MRTYSDDARLTLGELSVWTRTPTSELQALERCGVMACFRYSKRLIALLTIWKPRMPGFARAIA
jgi:hypothetical protein